MTRAKVSTIAFWGCLAGVLLNIFFGFAAKGFGLPSYALWFGCCAVCFAFGAIANLYPPPESGKRKE